MIKLKNVSKIYYQKGVVATGISKVNAEFKIGEFVVIVGESGSGKSTLLNVISGLDSYEEGEMYINGGETSHYSNSDFEEYRRKYIANIFQSFNLVNSYTVMQNIELVLLIHGYEQKVVKEKVHDIVKKVGLWEYRNQRVSKLSGGQKQRVAIARALAKETPIIVADEPTGNLDQASAKQIFSLLSEIAKDKLVIVVTHNFEQVSSYATRVITMHDGRIIEDKKVRDITYSKELNITSEHKEMSGSAKWNIAFRNSFNIITKFLLILAVFFIISLSLLSEYAGTKQKEYNNILASISQVFVDDSVERIIIKKSNNEAINDSDYEQIKKLDNIEHIEKNDIALDSLVTLSTKDYYEVYGLLENIDDFNGKLVKGRMPENEKEILLVSGENNYEIKYFSSLFYNQDIYYTGEFCYIDNLCYTDNNKYKIVGIAEQKDYNYNNMTFYLKESTLNEFKERTLLNYKYYSLKIGNTVLESGNANIIINDIVKPGSIYISEDFKYACKNTDCAKENVQIRVSDIYTEKTGNLTISQIITKNNASTIFNNQNIEQEELFNTIIVNPTDILNLSSNDYYQSSVFVKNVEKIDDTKEELESLGFIALPVKDTVASMSEITKLIEYFSHIGILIHVIILFAISYFIIYLILKSRKTYFAITRMLGANTKINKQLLNRELFIDATIAFAIICVISVLVNLGIINFSTVKEITNNLNALHYLIIYIVLIVMSQAISNRFTKKIFKDSMITTYNMEV